MDATRAAPPRVAATWQLLAAAIVLACLLNGAFAYLARVGVLESAAFDRYVGTYCDVARPAGFPTRTCACMTDPGLPGSAQLPDNAYIYRTDGWAFWPKVGKDVLVVLVVLVGMFAWFRSRRIALPAALATFAAWVAIGAGHAASGEGVVVGLLSLRAFAFVALALLSGWAAAGLPVISRWLVGLLLLECVLVAVELAFGMPTRACPNHFRAAGTFVLPSTMGVAAAGCAAFVTAAGLRGAVLASAIAASACLALAAGSASGLVLLLVLAAWIAWQALPSSRKPIGTVVAVACIALLLIGLPMLTNRPDVWNSVLAGGGRLDTLIDVVRANNWAQNLFGHGLSIGSNQATNLAAVGMQTMQSPLASNNAFYADSTVTMLLAQLGVVGVLAFYAMLAWAYRVDPAARPFYLIVAIASLTINVPETFPLNFLLGLALARSSLVAGRGSPLASTTPE